MILAEAIPGSLLVIDEGGLDVMIELGNLLGFERKRGKLSRAAAWGALVRTIDDQTLEPIWSTTRIIKPQLEVVAVIITAMRRRELRAMNCRYAFDVRDAMVDGDPVGAWTRGARAPGGF